MRLKTMLLYALHTACVVAVLLLAGFVVCEKWGDNEADLQREVLASLRTGLPEITASAKQSFTQVEETSAHYPNQTSRDYFQRAAHIQAKADSLLVLLDSLEQSPKADLLYFVQGQLPVFYSDAFKMCDYDPYVELNLPKSEPINQLFRSWKSDSHEQFRGKLSQVKLSVAIVGHIVMGYCHSKTNFVGTDCGWYSPRLSITNPASEVSDTVTADLILSGYFRHMHLLSMMYSLNGQVLPEKDGIAEFKVHHDKPGLYPLHFTVKQHNRRTDSVHIAEKTYWLRVRE